MSFKSVCVDQKGGIDPKWQWKLINLWILGFSQHFQALRHMGIDSCTKKWGFQATKKYGFPEQKING